MLFLADFARRSAENLAGAGRSADGRGYQTKANWLLRDAMLHFAKEASINPRKMTPRWG
jgi:hypothetical protein